MYYVYGISGPSLLIESTDSMIRLHTITNNTDPGDWHLHSLLAQLTACIDSKPMDKPPAFYGEIKCK